MINGRKTWLVNHKRARYSGILSGLDRKIANYIRTIIKIGNQLIL